MFPFLYVFSGRKPEAKHALPAWSLKETAWMLVAGAAAFAGLMLVFWVAARSVLV